MLRHKATGNGSHIGNGSKPLPPALLEYIPTALREAVTYSLDQEGQMTEAAEQRILRAIAENHRELQGSISGLKDSLHGHDKRLVLVEADIQEFKDVQKDASEERRNTARLVKGAIITSVVGILIGVFASFYGPRAAPPPAVQETVKQEAANASDLKDLIKEIRQDREDRKAEQATPVNVPKTKSRTTKPRPPEPFLNQLRDGEMRANEPWNTYVSMRHLSTPEERP